MGWRIESTPEIGHWAAERLGMGFHEQRSRALGLVKDGKIIAGVIYENWNRRSIMVHMVAEGRLNRAFISAIFHYAYRVCAVEKVLCPVTSSNTQSRRLVQHMGFCEEARLQDCHPDGDIVLYTLKRDDCRFLEGWNSGEIGTASTASS